MRFKLGLWNQTPLVQVLPLPFTLRVAWGKSLHLCVPLFVHL